MSTKTVPVDAGRSSTGAGEPTGPPPRLHRSIEFFPGGEYGPVAPEDPDRVTRPADDGLGPPAAATAGEGAGATAPAAGPGGAAAVWDDAAWSGPVDLGGGRSEPGGAQGRDHPGGTDVPVGAGHGESAGGTDPGPVGGSGDEGGPADEGAPTAAALGGHIRGRAPGETPAAPERMSLDELQSRVRRPRGDEGETVPAGDGSPPRPRRVLLIAAGAAAVIALVALAFFAGRAARPAPTTGPVDRGEDIERVRSGAFEQGRKAGVEQGRKAGVEEGREAGVAEGRRAGEKSGLEKGRQEGCRSVFDRAGSSTLMSGPGPRASLVRRQDCDRPS